MDYKQGYLYLFNQFTDLIEKLKEAQARAEELVISRDDSPIVLHIQDE